MNRKLNYYEKKSLQYYLGNIDGKSGMKLKRFIQNNI